jgi:hypothetical protein
VKKGMGLACAFALLLLCYAWGGTSPPPGVVGVDDEGNFVVGGQTTATVTVTATNTYCVDKYRKVASIDCKVAPKDCFEKEGEISCGTVTKIEKDNDKGTYARNVRNWELCEVCGLKDGKYYGTCTKQNHQTAIWNCKVKDLTVTITEQ